MKLNILYDLKTVYIYYECLLTFLQKPPVILKILVFFFVRPFFQGRELEKVNCLGLDNSIYQHSHSKYCSNMKSSKADIVTKVSLL